MQLWHLANYQQVFISFSYIYEYNYETWLIIGKYLLVLVIFTNIIMTLG